MNISDLINTLVKERDCLARKLSLACGGEVEDWLLVAKVEVENMSTTENECRTTSCPRCGEEMPYPEAYECESCGWTPYDEDE